MGQVIGVDTLRQQVPPCVRYGTTRLLIRDAMGSVPCSGGWEIGVATQQGSLGGRGVMVPLLRSYSSSPAMRNLRIAMVIRLP
jgi:hypothetical protein